MRKRAYNKYYMDGCEPESLSELIAQSWIGVVFGFWFIGYIGVIILSALCPIFLVTYLMSKNLWFATLIPLAIIATAFCGQVMKRVMTYFSKYLVREFLTKSNKKRKIKRKSKKS